MGLVTRQTLRHDKCNICSRYCIYHVKFTSYCELMECSRPIRFFIVTLMYNNYICVFNTAYIGLLERSLLHMSLYFFNLEKRNYNRKVIRSLKKPDGESITDELEILKEIELYYRNLYSSAIDWRNDLFEEFVGDLAIPKLEDTVRDELEGEITLKVTVDLQGCLRKNHSYARRLCYNHRKVYITVKLIKCKIRRNKHF